MSGDTILTSTRSYTVGGTSSTVTAKYNQNDGVLDLTTTTARDQAFWQEVLRTVGYRNTSDNPTTTLNSQPRVVQVEMLADNMFVRRDSAGLPHFYEVVAANDSRVNQGNSISWTNARDAAQNLYYAGMQGYLATITSAEESAFLTSRLLFDSWIGASDADSEGNWKWVAGPEVGNSFWSGTSSGSSVSSSYTNWGSGEPNDAGGGEDYAQMLGSSSNEPGKWNDLSNSNDRQHFLVEYSDSSVTEITFSKSFNISISAGNDAPVLSSASPALTSATEDDVQNAGQLISSFINDSTITDADVGAIRGGIAITSLNSGKGSWQYNLGNNTTWEAMGSLSNFASLLLRPTDAVRFVPDGENGSSASFTYRAWDQTSGSAGDRVNTVQRGGSTAFSTGGGNGGVNTASISVTPVNDAPVWNDTTAIDLGTVAGGDPSHTGTLVSVLVANGSDPDSGAAALGVAVVGLTETVSTTDIGDWEVSTNSGSSWTALTGITSSNARLLAPTDRLRFAPSGADGGTVSLDLRLWDRSPNSGTAGNTVDPGSGGGSTAFSTSSRSITATSSGITISGAASGLSLTEGQTLTPGSTITLSSGNLSSARVLIASGLSAGDQLEYSPISGNPITGSYNASKGELLLSGGFTSAHFQAALQAVTFKVGEDPTQFSSKRQIAYLLDNQTSSTAYTTVTVTASADAPSLSAATSAVSYQEGGSAVALHPSLTLADADDLQIASATVTIGNGRQLTDLLRFTGASGSPITATAYSSPTGVLRLSRTSGTASLAEFQEALRSITFENTSADPTDSGAATTRTITMEVTDANSDGVGAATATPISVTVNVSAINTAPVLTAGLQRS